MHMPSAENFDAVSYLENLLQQALALNASDIHIEPYGAQARIRLRVDGILHVVEELSLAHSQALVARTKVISHIDIAQHRLPLDGKFKCATPHGEIDIRVSVFPSVHGGTAVLRVLNETQAALPFEDLGMDIRLQQQLEELMHQPQGLLLVTGPTGAGKTTTIYSLLQLINDHTRSIITLEDPVEYTIEGVTQGQISQDIGFTFGKGIRSLLRQDPDVIVVGEIRDVETARSALEASMTGHLVVSTLHTNDACSTVIRLLDMTIEPYLLNAALAGVLAQRLVRKLCQDCRRPVMIDLAALGFSIGEVPTTDLVVYESTGCESCNYLGYRGRIGVYEYLEFDEDLKRLVISDRSHHALFEMALQKGMRTLTQDAFEKLLAGLISVSEFAKFCR